MVYKLEDTASTAQSDTCPVTETEGKWHKVEVILKT